MILNQTELSLVRNKSNTVLVQPVDQSYNLVVGNVLR